MSDDYSLNNQHSGRPPTSWGYFGELPTELDDAIFDRVVGVAGEEDRQLRRKLAQINRHIRNHVQSRYSRDTDYLLFCNGPLTYLIDDRNDIFPTGALTGREESAPTGVSSPVGDSPKFQSEWERSTLPAKSLTIDISGRYSRHANPQELTRLVFDFPGTLLKQITQVTFLNTRVQARFSSLNHVHSHLKATQVTHVILGSHAHPWGLDCKSYFDSSQITATKIVLEALPNLPHLANITPANDSIVNGMDIYPIPLDSLTLNFSNGLQHPSTLTTLISSQTERLIDPDRAFNLTINIPNSSDGTNPVADEQVSGIV
ncbi:hypothetical protein BCR39DRAFT_507286 [Naematelia encephala]|uniref:Uncharacterized protein n=1 Tax=Naematelia encephala TaxID=71784 RepID=A0A1Y2ASB2_9TREE|nr:hypothetical protein BCR39DRAFT_507286 [Naematelia encephala]